MAASAASACDIRLDGATAVSAMGDSGFTQASLRSLCKRGCAALMQPAQSRLRRRAAKNLRLEPLAESGFREGGDRLHIPLRLAANNAWPSPEDCDRVPPLRLLAAT